MKQQLFVFFALLLSLNGFSQITFEKGYFIDLSNKKIKCLIRNVDWKNNPDSFEYKLSEEGETKTNNLKLIREFGIDNVAKYIRAKVNMDRSSENITTLSKVKNPIFKEEDLLLKVLVEGKATLYYYEEGNLKRYFYAIENTDIEQLVFKSYYTDIEDRAFNNHYKQQLTNSLKCASIKKSTIEGLSYKKNSLVKVFTTYNNCSNSASVNFEEGIKRDLFNLSIRPRMSSSSLTFQSAGVTDGKYDLSSEISFGIGIEFEYIFPFNQSKWSFALEPSYQSYSSEKTVEANNVSGNVLNVKVDYSSIEVPMTLRHYMYLDNNSKLFINVSYITDFSSESTIELSRADNSNFNTLIIQTSGNLAFGFGYQLNDKLGLEIRYASGRDVLNYQNSSSNFRTLSFILGYSFL